ncbi:MAG: EFR1 family ferrodoxin [Candidatus Marinimicrobia bacterium]|jgi:formate hydrogenlyase subunit 6/NADH:ubiquinone oxidoreductase subunit I/flavodoxin|nr:EFR1 family ferrodoxin [Candidatus Neomarinimicrobiota bacterium]MCK9484246.1 EFR1 family ferrodoxin [Candidatus Neomarinimicrobiota bacterium]MCK9560080.1 EFR1 family ferrodoxin [Candidatus Neomarinimicrobiota bacterium]
MSTEIYYFSGTGNSLVVARRLAEKTQGKLIAIASVIEQESIRTNADRIGIVFPSYLAHLYGIPLIVERFVKKLRYADSQYIFAVCTCGGYQSVNALPTLKNLARLIKNAGGKLSAQFSVRLPMNNLDYDHIPVPISTDQEKMFEIAQRKIESISRRILRRKRDKHRIAKSLFNLLMSPMYYLMRKPCVTALIKYAKEPQDSKLTFRELIPLSDNSIYVDEKCNGCAVCTRVCPVNNIKMVNKKPVWQNHCEMCLACAEWCPEKAIHHWSRADGIRYHHPAVKIAEMLRQSNSGFTNL